MEEKRKNRRLGTGFSILFAGICVAQVVYWGFWPSVMRNFGYTDTEIGVFSSVSTATGMLLGLLFSYLVDRTGRPGLFISCIYSTFNTKTKSGSFCKYYFHPFLHKLIYPCPPFLQINQSPSRIYP